MRTSIKEQTRFDVLLPSETLKKALDDHNAFYSLLQSEHKKNFSINNE